MMVRPAPLVATAHNATLKLDVVSVGEVNEVASNFRDMYGNPADASEMNMLQAWVARNNSTMEVSTKSISNGTYR